jgi:hypothetical protein
MKMIFFIIQFFIYLDYVCPVPLDTLPSNIKDFITEYRNIKSKVFVTTGGRLGDAGRDENIKKEKNKLWKRYCHEMFFSPGESDDEVIYILSNNYSILSIDFVKNEEMEYRDWSLSWNLIKTTKEDHYIINIEERVIGAIHNGNIDSYATIYARKAKTLEERYDVFITEDGPKVESDSERPRFFILEHDVPILMENIKKGLDMVKPYKPERDREKEKDANYIVEWW